MEITKNEIIHNGRRVSVLGRRIGIGNACCSAKVFEIKYGLGNALFFCVRACREHYKMPRWVAKLNEVKPILIWRFRPDNFLGMDCVFCGSWSLGFLCDECVEVLLETIYSSKNKELFLFDE